MKNAKSINLKNMKETIVNYSGDQKEFDKIWDAFYQMACIGFIDRDTWNNFSDQCAGWYIDEESACVFDQRHCPEGVEVHARCRIQGVTPKADGRRPNRPKGVKHAVRTFHISQRRG